LKKNATDYTDYTDLIFKNLRICGFICFLKILKVDSRINLKPLI